MKNGYDITVDYELMTQKLSELKNEIHAASSLLAQCETAAQELGEMWSGEAAQSMCNRLRNNETAVAELLSTLRYGAETFDTALRIYRESEQSSLEALRAVQN